MSNVPACRLRYLLRPVDQRRGERDLPLLSISQYRGVVLRSALTADEARADDLTNYKVCQAGDIVVNRMSAYQGALGRSGHHGIVSPDYIVFRPVSACDSRWLHHLMRSAWFVAEMAARIRGIGSIGTANVRTPRVSAEEIGDIRVPLPSSGQQRAIADFLDSETARIDALIAKKRRLIEVLHERARSRLVELVLGDLGQSEDPSPSGLYRTVPYGWSETSLRHLRCQVQTGPFGSQLHSDEYVEDGWPVVNPMNLVDGGIRAVPTMTVSDDKRNDLARHVLQVGDIVFGRRGEMGRAGLVEDQHAGWLCGTGSLRLRVTPDLIVPPYLALLLGTPPARAYFQLSSVGSTMDNLNSEILLGFPTLVPPLAEQWRIVEEVGNVRAADALLDESLVNQIHLLVEHRRALITAAVTGELAVPGLAG